MDEFTDTDIEKVAKLFRRLGAADGQDRTMARQLLKRARQIAEEEKISKVDAAETLLKKVIEARQSD